MPLDESHPHCVRDNEGQLVLTAEPGRTRAALRDEARWRRRIALAGSVSVPLGGVAGLAAGLAVGVRLDTAGAAVAVSMLGALAGLVLGLTRPWPRLPGPLPRSAPATPVHPWLVAHAPAEASYPQLAGWQRILTEYDDAAAYLLQGRQDAGLGEPAREVGDRSTWFFTPADLPGLEDRYAVAREAVCEVAAELRADPPPEAV